MNGRIYDPQLGRFMTADPFVQDPGNGQAYNRYSYVFNNPLAFTDPSGYFSLGHLFQTIVRVALFGVIPNLPFVRDFVAHSQIAQFAIQIGAGIFGGPLGAAEAAAYINDVKGGSLGSDLKAFVLTYGQAEAFDLVGDATGGHFHWEGANAVTQDGVPLDKYFLSSSHFANIIGHAVVGCAFSAAGGGKCESGAFSGAAGAFAGPVVFQSGFVGGLVSSTVIGGTASVIGGGKFINGARTAAFGYLFNAAAGRFFGGIVGGAVAGFALSETGPFDAIFIGGGRIIGGAIGSAVEDMFLGAGNAVLSEQLPSELPGTDKQFGKKFGEHMDPELPGYRTPEEYRARANEIYQSAEATIERMSNGETRYTLGNDLLRLDPRGWFRSMYPIK